MLWNGWRNYFPLSIVCFVCVPGQIKQQGTSSRKGRGAARGLQELRVCTFLYSSSSPPAPARSAAAATKKSPSARVVKKQAFILHVLLTVTAWRHSLAKVIMKQIKSQTQASLFPTPQESQHCTKLYLQGKQSEMASPKNPLAIQKKTFKTSVTVTPSTQPASHWLLPGLA